MAWHPPVGILQTFPNLKLILSLGAGVDHILRDPHLPESVPIARLIPDQLVSQMTEYVMQAILAYQGRVFEYRAQQQLQAWRHNCPPIIRTRSQLAC